MTRRGFFRRLGVVVAALVVRPVQPASLGISIRFVRSFNVTAPMPARIDVLYGMATLRPALAARVWG